MKKTNKNHSWLFIQNALVLFKQGSFYFVISFVIFFETSAQIPTHTWRTHADYSDAKGLEIVQNLVYCFSKNGFYYFDKTNNQAITLSKLDNFSETNIAQIRYNAEFRTLLVAYQTGNLDIINIAQNGIPEKIQNIDFIKRTDAIQDSKFINQIEFQGDFAYLAADFGLVVLDIKKNEIKETYQNIGKDGKKVAIKQMVFARDSLFVNTSDGILGTKFASNINLQFYGNWKQITDNQLFKIKTFPKDNLIKYPNEIETDTDGHIWIADGINGLVSNFSGSFKSYQPNSVKSDIFDIFYQNQKLYAVGIEGNVFEKNEWNTLNLNTLPTSTNDIIDQYGYRWQLNGQILKVTDDATNRTRYYSSGIDLPSIYVNTIALDHDNLLWVGTNNGVAVIVTSKDIFTTSIKPYTPFYQSRRLLLQEVVNKIVVDGGNRKWIATQNSLNLFSPSADEQILNFTEENSPLPSKNIIDLAIDSNSGEVFILTQNGLLSYRNDATEASENLSSIKIFPNPVRPDFQGVITISGLMENTTIKITDTGGRLIHESKSNGGTASWDLQNSQGNRATSGIYLVFCIAEDGSESFVGKAAVIR
jgi:ligand-binding sensor domain-containing protein